MASYSMCHLKLDMMLNETGYVPPKDPKRLSVWLTNSLEAPQEDDNSLPLFGLARAINEEAKGANDVKADKPIMCIIGNPPYSGESANKGDWIMGLMEAYKKEPGGVEKLKERNPKWINDDYVKFIRMSEHMIEENGEGVLAFITNHGYLRNPTFRGMRWQLLKSFDTVRVLDLHGNSNKQEISPDGSIDKNVFDIKQGVAIIIATKRKRKTAEKKSLGILYHDELWGLRKEKSTKLIESSIGTLKYTKLSPHQKYLMFYDINDDLLDKYDEGFSCTDIFENYSTGILTARDDLNIDFEKQQLLTRMEDIVRLNDEALRTKYSLGKDSRDWKVEFAKQDLNGKISPNKVTAIEVRPFDKRWTYYTGKNKGIHTNPRHDTTKHLLTETNFSLVLTRTIEGSRNFADCLVISNALTHHALSIKEVNSFAPLYLYPDENDLDQTRRVNMEPKIRAAIEDAAEHPEHGRPDEVAIFDYIYGVLHCAAYRETYAEFLKIDFPRVPYPSSPEVFWDISAKGSALRKLHLMEGIDAGTAYPFKGEAPEEGSGFVEIIGKKSFVLTDENKGNVLLNETQYFQDVPKTAWEFYIGGYQPAQKWLKDRKARTLSFDDRMHYRNIIHILMETDRIMKTIEMDL